MVWLPALSAAIVVSGMSALIDSIVEFHDPSVGTNGNPVPTAPTPSMKPSARSSLVVESVAEAVIRTAGVDELMPTVPLFGFGAAVTPEVVGPVPSMVNVIVAEPLLPAESVAVTSTV